MKHDEFSLPKPKLVIDDVKPLNCKFNKPAFSYDLKFTVNLEFELPDLNFEFDLVNIDNFDTDSINGSSVTFDIDDINAKLSGDIKKIFANASNPFLVKRATGPVIHIGTDSEFKENQVCTNNKDTFRNDVISCQAYIRYGNRVTTLIYYPLSYEYKHRPTFKKFIGDAVNKALKEGTIDELPSMIYVYGHFLRADLPSFRSFFRMRDEVSGIGGTFASIMKTGNVDIEDSRKKKFTPEPIALADHNRHKYLCYMRYVDTMLHTPGRAGLAVAGEIIGLPKLKIPQGYSIERMDELLEGDKEAFEAYAMRDAEIACEYGLYLHHFIRNELGLDGLPATAGNCSVAAFKLSLKELIKKHPELGSFQSVFGVDYTKEAYWHVKNQRNQTRSVKEVASRREDHKAFVSMCYHGARNEGFSAGPTDTTNSLIDLDLRGAYTIGLCDLFTFDYENIRVSYDVNDYIGHVAGYLHVEFEFTSNPQYPCLPVSAGERGLIFPLKGESYCTAAEIMVAKELGCNIKIIHGIVVPWKQTNHRLFEPFVNKVRTERNKAQADKDKAKDEVWKNLGNQLYGKLAQAVKGDKKAYDTDSFKNKVISPSGVTHEMMAAYVTGFIRGVIAELLNQIPTSETTVSVTTDGWLGTYPLDKFDTSGSLCSRYQSLCDRIDGEPMLEEKGRAHQVIAMKTRGSLTAQAFGGQAPILAKAGVKPIISIENSDTKESIKDKQNEEMINLYLNRSYDSAPMEISSLISLRDMWLTESDLVRKKLKRRPNLEYDFKRMPVTPRMVSVRDREHLTFDTKPWESIEEFKQVRAIFDGFRRSHNLKTLDDWYNWEDYYQTKITVKKGSGININKKGSADILRRIFLRAYARECWGLTRDGNNQEIADWLSCNGYSTNADELKNAKRAKLEPNIVPLTHKVIALLKIIHKRYPEFAVEMLFPVTDWAKANGMLKV